VVGFGRTADIINRDEGDPSERESAEQSCRVTSVRHPAPAAEPNAVEKLIKREASAFRSTISFEPIPSISLRDISSAHAEGCICFATDQTQAMTTPSSAATAHCG
jgi:hypothetical protein